ncbi:MAG: TonB-dependent receptor [Pseudomonadaceae bacterium]|nr:TonB-dependent receptor [Pseudomonadaceae bacterium]
MSDKFLSIAASCAYISATLGFLMCSIAIAAPLPAAIQQELDRSPMEEIVVTARRRSESKLHVPLSVSAFTQDTIDTIGLTRLSELARFTPGFSFDSATGRQPSSDRPNIRGLTTIRNGIANTSSAATFIDGIYLGGSIQSSALFNLERVEIVRGPQTALYGRGTYAGAINYVTGKPGNELDGGAKVTTAEHGTLQTSAWLSGPLYGNALQFYLGASRQEYEGEYTNTITGRKIGDEQSDDLSGSLYWSPTDLVDVVLQLGWNRTDDGHFASFLQPRELNNCCFRTAATPRAREYFSGTSVEAERVTLATDLLDAAGGAGVRLHRYRAALNVGWQLASGYEIRSLTGYIDDDLERGIDGSFAGYEPLPFLPGFFNSVEDIEQIDFSQELRLTSPLLRNFNWSLGLYHYTGRLNDLNKRRVFRDAAGNIIIAPSFNNLSEEKIGNSAIFGSVLWKLSNNWTTSVELRYARDEITLINRRNDADNTIVQPSPLNATFKSLTPRFTLRYLSSQLGNYYLSIAKGSKPGTFNVDAPDESRRNVSEEKIWSYEVGAKTQWSDYLSSGIAIYYMDVDKQQLTQLVELASGATASLITNIGRSAIWGAELEASAILTNNLSVAVSYSYTRAVYKDYISSEEADRRGSDGSIAQNKALGNVNGNRLPRTPTHMFSLIALYERKVSDSTTWYTNASYSFESSKFAQEHNLIGTGSRHIAGLRTGLRWGRWDLNLWVDNLFDERTANDILRFLDNRSGTLPSFPQQGVERASNSPRGFALSLPRGRQTGLTVKFHLAN